MFIYALAWASGIVSLIFAYLGGEHDSMASDFISYILFAGSFVLATGLAVTNFFKAEPKFLRYEEMVHAKLDEYFKRVNAEFEGRRVRWCVVHGHFWVEIRLPTYRRSAPRELPTQLPTVET